VTDRDADAAPSGEEAVSGEPDEIDPFAALDALDAVAGSADDPREGNPVPEADVRRMFDSIAPVYDRMNSVLTLGLDGRWRRAAVAATGLRPADSVVDVACGTGKLAALLADRVGPFGRVRGIDLSTAMIEVATREYGDLVQLEFHVGNALALPFEADEFDAATIAFGIRNLADFVDGFRELARVVRPGGTVVCLELSVPRPRWWGTIFHASFRRLAPAIGGLMGHRDEYRYLPESLEGFPDPDRLANAMRIAGLGDVYWRGLGLGSVALHVGRVAG
jgi:demethylmenaquinone methyltransferase/2-methoxy-6-polyprenyl-1,4-benzoquinol methylase